MSAYTCTTTAGRLSEEQRLKVVESITATHSEETGDPRYLVQVIFYEVDAHAHSIGGKKAPEEQIWIRGDIRSGRTEAVKRNMLGRIVRDVAASGWFRLTAIQTKSGVIDGLCSIQPGTGKFFERRNSGLKSFDW